MRISDWSSDVCSSDLTKKKSAPDSYAAELRRLQIQLVCLQRHLIAHNEKLLVIIEGRDGAGKDGTIKRITEHMSPRETRVVALGKPSDREQTEWYFQRHVTHLPAGGEFVLISYAVFCLKKKTKSTRNKRTLQKWQSHNST